MEQADLPFERFETLLAAHPSVDMSNSKVKESRFCIRDFRHGAGAARKNIKVSLISNGSLMSESTAEELVSLGIEKVSVSMESADPETFRQIRGGKLEK